MRTRTSSEQLEAEAVWGIEALDPLEQLEWAQALWQKVDAPVFARRPLLLIYPPSAERAAIRCLNTLSRFARRRGIPAFFQAPLLLPMLRHNPAPSQTLESIHRATRFVNLPSWLKHRQRLGARIVLTAPLDEYSSITKHRDFDLVRVPAEEPSYCDRKAAEILATLLPPSPGRPDEMQTALERVLAEAGVAGVPVPLSLLARHLLRQAQHLGSKALVERLQGARLDDFVEVIRDKAVAGAAVVFRGRWLAEKIDPAVEAGRYASLSAMLADSDPRLPSERLFFLSLLVALRARGNDPEVGRLLTTFYHHFHAATVAAKPAERKAWGAFHGECVLPLFGR